MMNNSLRKSRFMLLSAYPALCINSFYAPFHQLNRSKEESGGGMHSEASRKLGVALVGLGKYSEEELAPALLQTNFCRLSGLVTGSPEKIEKWQQAYDVPDENIYSYQDFDKIADNPDIDIVYIVLPNAMHKEFTVRAARAGKHVICEKPMAVSVEEAKEMIDACEEAGKLLSIGYRMHFDPSTFLIEQFREEKTFGAFSSVAAANSAHKDAGEWRLDKKMAGGGPLMDLGIYCVQAFLYSTGELPVGVKASFGENEDPEKFSSVEQSITFELIFPSGISARGYTSYAEEEDQLRITGERGWLKFSPAFSYRGLKGDSSHGRVSLPVVNQQALQMDDFARCVMEGTGSNVSGEMGLRDMKILMAIYESARTRKEVKLDL